LAARFTFLGEAASRALKCNQEVSESKNRDSGGMAEVVTLARFLISLLNLGSVSDQ
jgi:hypothetical protein